MKQESYVTKYTYMRRWKSDRQSVGQRDTGRSSQLSEINRIYWRQQFQCWPHSDSTLSSHSHTHTHNTQYYSKQRIEQIPVRLVHHVRYLYHVDITKRLTFYWVLVEFVQHFASFVFPRHKWFIKCAFLVCIVANIRARNTFSYEFTLSLADYNRFESCLSCPDAEYLLQQIYM